MGYGPERDRTGLRTPFSDAKPRSRPYRTSCGTDRRLTNDGQSAAARAGFRRFDKAQGRPEHRRGTASAGSPATFTLRLSSTAGGVPKRGERLPQLLRRLMTSGGCPRLAFRVAHLSRGTRTSLGGGTPRARSCSPSCSPLTDRRERCLPLPSTFAHPLRRVSLRGSVMVARRYDFFRVRLEPLLVCLNSPGAFPARVCPGNEI